MMIIAVKLFVELFATSASSVTLPCHLRDDDDGDNDGDDYDYDD